MGSAAVGVAFWKWLGRDGILGVCCLPEETVKHAQVMTVNAQCENESKYATPRWMARIVIAALVGRRNRCYRTARCTGPWMCNSCTRI